MKEQENKVELIYPFLLFNPTNMKVFFFFLRGIKRGIKPRKNSNPPKSRQSYIIKMRFGSNRHELDMVYEKKEGASEICPYASIYLGLIILFKFFLYFCEYLDFYFERIIRLHYCYPQQKVE